MEATRSESSLLQIFVRLLDGKTATLRFTNPKTKCHVIKQQIFDITKIPIQSQRLISNGYQIDDDSVISGSGSTFHLLLRLRGGKGGFGSLLRGAATKAGQKKTNNFDACRDMSGRRLRHVNAEKKLEEWKAEEEDRRLEKIAEEFIKKTAKKGKKGVGDGAAEKYVEKYREESAKCVAAVEEAIRDACGGGQGKVNGKRKDKVALESLDAKKLKIWMGKRKLGYIDSGSEDDDSSDDEEESEKSVVLNNGNHSDSSKDVVSNGGKDGGSSAGASCESGSEEDQESGAKESSKSGQNGELSPDEGVGLSETPAHDGLVVQNASVVPLNSSDTSANEVVEAERKDIDGPSSNTSACRDISEERIDVTGSNASVSKTALNEEVLSSKKETAVNLDDFNSAAELEALGMERLKTELQAHGLKCGGTLQERAARLFLLKSTPLEKLPKKLFAKK